MWLYKKKRATKSAREQCELDVNRDDDVMGHPAVLCDQLTERLMYGSKQVGGECPVSVLVRVLHAPPSRGSSPVPRRWTFTNGRTYARTACMISPPSSFNPTCSHYQSHHCCRHCCESPLYALLGQTPDSDLYHTCYLVTTARGFSIYTAIGTQPG